GTAKFFSPHEVGFYEIIGHQTMVALFGGAGLLAAASLSVAAIRYWRAIGLPAPSKVGTRNLLAGLVAAFTLRNLCGGAGEGCTWPEEEPSTSRRAFHHLVFYGFLLCFTATVTGTIYHYGFDEVAPYPPFSLPKIFGTVGGVGILVGVTGLAWLRRKSTPSMEDRRGLAASLMFLLFMTSLTGLLLMLLRQTSWLGLMLCVHLASVLALFMGMACGKFVHGLYRLIALIGYEVESQKAE
ncbi:MAG: tricarballylate utilization protein TcuB, partial [Pseudomonadales bacterium]|nr:tricarballylate utilization protein TcuB [Pseudomonadales bacterium]